MCSVHSVVAAIGYEVQISTENFAATVSAFVFSWS